MSARPAHISPLQYATMVTSAYLGLGIFEFPRPLVSSAGRLGLYGLCADIALAWAAIGLAMRTSQLAERGQAPPPLPHALGPAASLVYAVVSFSYQLTLAMSAGMMYTFVLSEIFLPTTPLWAINGALTWTAAYLAGHGTTSLARTLQAAYLPTVIVAGLSVGLSVSLIHHPVLLLPSPDITLLPIVSASYRQFVIFLGLPIMFHLYPSVRTGQFPAAQRYTLWAWAGISLLFIGLYELTLSIFGPQLTAQLRWPVVSTYEIIAVHGFFISKLGTLLIVLWTIVIVGFLAVRLWCLGQDMTLMFPRAAAPAYRWGIIGSAALLTTVGPFLANAQILAQFDQRILLPAGLAYLTAVPLAVWLLARVRRTRVPSA